jgi:hemerythrin-like domain-containing protein
VKKPTETLEAEHRIIEKILGAMARLVEVMETSQETSPADIAAMVEFMRTFADRCHHGKEEKLLFPVLELKGVPVSGCPLGILIHEHTKGRTLVNALSESAATHAAGNLEAKETLLASMKGLLELYPSHIWKEDYLLFPLTDKILSTTEQEELAKEFEQVEKEIGMETHLRCVQIAEQLAEKTQSVN